MGWLWPHFKRLWAAAGAIAVGLAVNYLFALWGEQSVPSVQRLTHFLWDSWYWTGGALILFAVVSVFAERAHRRHAAPHFIGEVRRRGGAKLPPLSASTTSATTLIVGREDELKQLQDWFASVLQGERRVVFVSGEAGIGKTTFVNTFIDSLRREGVRIARGQCVEQYGAGEPYMPMLEALTQLGRGEESQQLLAILHRLAPAWLAQLPALLTAEERARIQSETQGLTQQRMLREMAETLAALATDAPLVLLLEDLHWSDASTLDLIAALARRTEPARLLVLGTYRPVEMLAGDHPLRALKEELEIHQQCHELRLKLLSETEIATYLKRRFANDGAQYGSLAPAIYARTDGNALFMVNVVDYLVAQGPELDASKLETPRNIRQMIERNLRRLDAEEQAVLETASVAGAEFSAAAVAAALERPVGEIDGCCTRLSRNEQFIRSQGESRWPDGTLVTGYRFVHALYQEVLYDRAPVVSRAEAHRRIAAREETAYGERAGEIAAELADHYSRANDNDKAVKYFQLAGERAVARGAMVEAERHYARALALLSELPESVERDRRELGLQTALGQVLMVIRGWAAPETEKVYLRAHELARTCGTAEQQFSSLVGWFGIAFVGGGLPVARERLKPVCDFASQHPEPWFVLEADHHEWSVAVSAGELEIAQRRVEHGLALYDAQLRSATMPIYSAHHPAVCGHGWGAMVFWLRGFPEAGRRHANQALTLAQELGDSPSIAWALGTRAHFHQLVREVRPALEMAQAAIAKAEETAFPYALSYARIVKGWALAELGRADEGVDQIREAIATLSATRAGLWLTSFLGTLAEACGRAGRVEEGLSSAADALNLVQQSGECCWEAGIYRVRGELLLNQNHSNSAEAQASFERAIEIARKQSAKSWELRATMSLARLLATQGRSDEARTTLAEIYNWFTEGFDTADLKEAQGLLDDLRL